MDAVLKVLLPLVTFLSVSVAVWGIWSYRSWQLIRHRLHTEVAKTGSTPQSLIGSLATGLKPLHRRIPLGWYVRWVLGLIEAAGLRMDPFHFIVWQELGTLAGLGMACAVAFLGAAKRLTVPWVSVHMIIGFLVPVVWINAKIRARRRLISRDLPEVLDLLAMCVGAGADFMGSLNRVVGEFRPSPVRDELGIILQEVRVGRRRRDALRSFARRVRTPEASSFARALIQADRMGTGLSETLAILSEDMRLRRYHWAERFAQQAPLKMLLPLVLSLGSALLIITAPILIQFFRGGLMTNPMKQTGQRVPTAPQVPTLEQDALGQEFVRE